MVEFTVQQTCGKARASVLRTAHGEVATPVFMPCGTAGTVKGVTSAQLRETGVQMVLANAYHLMLRPGAEVVAALGGLHRMMAWDGPILTDSGGYQVFSLAQRRTVCDDGVTFQSHIDGAAVELTPEICIDVQVRLGADIIMQLDECPPGDASRQDVAAAVRRSADWAARCRKAWEDFGRLAHSGHPQALFGIQQGGVHADLRAESAKRIVALDLPGYAIGGLSVGEGHDRMVQLPADRPRYLMGVGEPRDILAAVASGVDMFDCVLPTRNARNAQAFTWTGRLRLRNAAFTRDCGPIEDGCPCYACRNFPRAAIRHYFLSEEMLGPTLVTIHNLTFFARFTAAIRQAIAAGDLPRRAEQWSAGMV
ncbi:MAG: queuine tRNA-ribosyltransferase [Phycisphaerae bacterium SM23_33]|nr:MAG: queuine tRNA-ribosyltransferase [Phycisphaerae bacterium SM23_33]